MVESSNGKGLATSLYERIKEDILTHRLKPGQVVSEREFVARFGVSRTPIRHAIARLQGHGLITPQARRGCIVSPLNLTDVAEILYLRGLMEGAAAELAARHVTEAELVHLERLADQSYVPGDPSSYEEFVRANREFHLAVAQASRNKRLVAAITTLLDDMRRVITTTIALSSRVRQMQRDHGRIVEALRQHDPAEAKMAVLRAMDASRRRVMVALQLSDGKP
jgi:DNA-binding GntR family transcriptional regulator